MPLGIDPMPFGNPRAESQRDSVSKPRVASRELPWVTIVRRPQPQRGCDHRTSPEAATPLGLTATGPFSFWSADILVRGLTITQRRTRMSALQSPVPTTLEKCELRTSGPERVAFRGLCGQECPMPLGIDPMPFGIIRESQRDSAPKPSNRANFVNAAQAIFGSCAFAVAVFERRALRR